MRNMGLYLSSMVKYWQREVMAAVLCRAEAVEGAAAHVLGHYAFCLRDSVCESVCDFAQVATNLAGCNLVVYNVPA